MIHRRKLSLIMALAGSIILMVAPALALVASLFKIADLNTGSLAWHTGVGYDNNGNLYAYGGGLEPPTLSDKLYRYDRVSDTWVDTGNDMPEAYRVPYLNSGSDGRYLISIGSKIGTIAEDVIIYDTILGTWGVDTPPQDTNFTRSGTTANGRYYLFSYNVDTSQNTLYSAEINDLGNNAIWTFHSRPTSICNPQWATTVHDPLNDKLIIFCRDFANLIEYDINSDSWEFHGGITDPPVNSASGNAPVTLAFYDLSEGVVFGVYGYPSPGQIELFSYDSISNTVATTGILWTPILDYEGATINKPTKVATVTVNNLFQFAFGSGSYLDDAMSYTPPDNWYSNLSPLTSLPEVEPTIDSWWQNFLTSLHLNSPAGKLIIGLTFMSILAGFLLYLHAPVMIVISLLGLGSTVLFAATVLTTDTYLAGLTIVGVGIFATLIFKVIGRGDSG